MIMKKYEGMMRRIHLSDRLHSMLYEKNVIGNAFVWVEFDDSKKEWGKLVILPPEEIIISRYPMSDQAKVMYQPEIANQVIELDKLNMLARVELSMNKGWKGIFWERLDEIKSDIFYEDLDAKIKEL